MRNIDVIIIGAGAAGLMCAIEAGKRGRQVMVLDHANKIGKKILMSGGGRCNFTNYHIHPDNYLSHNKHFCKSALSRYTQWDFIDLVHTHNIPYHEKIHGQLFCDNKSKDIVDMLLSECNKYNVEILIDIKVEKITKANFNGFELNCHDQQFHCDSLVIATGGLSIPTMGASPFGYKVAEQFGIAVKPTRAGLVPFTLKQEDKIQLENLSGISIHSIVYSPTKNFRENILFTHRGLSGPAILQISSYWTAGQNININLLPDVNLLDELKHIQNHKPKLMLKTFLSEYLPKNFITTILNAEIAEAPLHTFSHKKFEQISQQIHAWTLTPNGTEGYRTAEVTLGGVDCDAISSKTMEAHQIPGLYFIGEVLDVSGWLGGYNFQWAWSSGWAAGQVV